MLFYYLQDRAFGPMHLARLLDELVEKVILALKGRIKPSMAICFPNKLQRIQVNLGTSQFSSVPFAARPKSWCL